MYFYDGIYIYSSGPEINLWNCWDYRASDFVGPPIGAEESIQHGFWTNLSAEYPLVSQFI